MFKRMVIVQAWFSYAIVHMLTFMQKIKLGAGSKYYGIPVIMRCKESHISLGAKCVLRSSFMSNALGVQHRCIIRTLAPQSFITIGDSVGMSGAAIVARKGITIGDRVLLGINCVITDSDHHPLDPALRFNNDASAIRSEEITIEDDVWVGAGVYILKGVRVGARSIIGAGSVVVSNVPSDAIVAGNPAKVVRYVKDD